MPSARNRVCDYIFTWSLFLHTGSGSYVGIANDRLANSWIDSYLNADVQRPASDWAAELTNARRWQAPNQLMPVEHPWARDFLDRREHDVW